MKFNKNSVSSSYEDHRNTPIWTVPDHSLSQARDETVLPNASDVIHSSGPEFTDQPPNYFDISIIPNRTILNYNEASPLVEPSKVKIKRKNDGILSFDPMLDKNPDQLWLYFMTYLNEKPRMSIKIHGYYTEQYHTTEYSGRGGYSRTVSHTRTVTDFNFDINLATYIPKQWRHVAVIPSEKSTDRSAINSFRDALEQYTRSEKSIKQIHCQKQLLGWNFKEVRQKIEQIVSSTGYRRNISISFSTSNHVITARSSSKLSRFANSTWTRVLCVLSCCCLIFGPIYLYLRSKGSTNHQIIADYNMISSSDHFLRANSAMIANCVTSHSRDSHLAKLA